MTIASCDIDFKRYKCIIADEDLEGHNYAGHGN